MQCNTDLTMVRHVTLQHIRDRVEAADASNSCHALHLSHLGMDAKAKTIILPCERQLRVSPINSQGQLSRVALCNRLRASLKAGCWHECSMCFKHAMQGRAPVAHRTRVGASRLWAHLKHTSLEKQA